MFFGNLPLEITCSKCGKQIKETVKWLKADSRKCPFCDTLIDTTEFRRGIDEATNRTHEMLRNLRRSLKSVKIKIKTLINTLNCHRTRCSSGEKGRAVRRGVTHTSHRWGNYRSARPSWDAGRRWLPCRVWHSQDKKRSIFRKIHPERTHRSGKLQSPSDEKNRKTTL
jgi:hypothetical protein